MRIARDEAPLGHFAPACEGASLQRELPPPAFLLPDADARLEGARTEKGLAAGLPRIDAERALASGELIQILPEWVFPLEYLAVELNGRRDEAEALALEVSVFFERKASGHRR